jgi:hypothetical protein
MKEGGSKTRGRGSMSARQEETNLILDFQPALLSQIPTPLPVDLALEVERKVLVGDVTGGDDEGEAKPEEEGVDSEESSIVEDDAGVAEERGEEAERGGGS